MADSGQHSSSDRPIQSEPKNTKKGGMRTIESGQTLDGRSLHDDKRNEKKCENKENSQNSVDLTKPMDPETYSKISSSSSSDLPRFVEGQEVHLLSDDDEKQPVGRGTVTAILPTAEVGGTELGRKYVGVRVEEIIDRDEELIRPYPPYRKIGDAGGAIIAWKRMLLQCI